MRTPWLACVVLVAACTSRAPGGTSSDDVTLFDDIADVAASEVSPDLPTPDAQPADATPDADAPDATTPDAAPDVTAPDVTAPDVTAPDVTAPDVAAPDVTAPDVTAPDVAAPDVTSDAAPVRCTSDRECSAAGLVCGRAAGVCVECNAATDCRAGQSCVGSRCVTPVSCTSSRMCPGQVCSTTLRVCVDCDTDVDCAMGQRCVGNACVTGGGCRSAMDCAPGQQCDAARGVCVECLRDADCGAGRLCGSDNRCAAMVCTPGTRTCSASGAVQTCNARGDAYSEAPCPGGQRCAMGACVAATVCTPGQTRCDASGRREVCASDGSAWQATACPTGQACMGGECVMTCPSGLTNCNGTCRDTQTDAAHCGACGRACAAGQTCLGGVCMAMTVCAAPFTQCGSACVDLQGDTGHCGTCNRQCPTGTYCQRGACTMLTGEALQVAQLGLSTGCRIVNHELLSGDDRGGIAMSSTRVLYTGDTATIVALRPDLVGHTAAAGGARHDGLLHDVTTGAVYVLLDAADRQPQGTSLAQPFTAVRLGVLDGTTGALTATRIPLSVPVTLGNNTGIFSGRGRAWLYSGTFTTTLGGARANAWYQVALPSGAVTLLAQRQPSSPPLSCENWAFWGVAEFAAGEPAALYATGNGIVRYRIRDGVSSQVATSVPPTSVSYAGLCSFAVAPSDGRWYFHYEAMGFAGYAAEALGYCPATFGAPTCATGTLCGGVCVDTLSSSSDCGGCGIVCSSGRVCTAGRCVCPAGSSVCGAGCADLQTDAANCGACGRTCTTGQRCVAGACVTAPTTTRFVRSATPPTTAFVDACRAPGAVMALPGVDDNSTRAPLSFPFRYWNVDRAAGFLVNVSSNGFLSLEGGTSASLSGTLPSATAPNGTIAAYWRDNQNRASGQCIATVGAIGQRRQVFEWVDAHHCCSDDPAIHHTYEIILHETGEVDVLYQDMRGATAATMGMENVEGTLGVPGCPSGTLYSCIPATGNAVRYVPTP